MAGSGCQLWLGQSAGKGTGILDCSQVVFLGPVDGVEGNVSVQRYELRFMSHCKGPQVYVGELPVPGHVAEAHHCVVKQAYVVGNELMLRGRGGCQQLLVGLGKGPWSRVAGL